jgi:hypothetical protein
VEIDPTIEIPDDIAHMLAGQAGGVPRAVLEAIAVSDTSPICYLILIGEIDLLPKLFSQVLMPQAVIAEFAP